MCMGSSAKAPPPPEPNTDPRTFAYGPKGVVKTAIDIPKESKASPDYEPPGTPKKKKTDAAALNITT